MPKVRPSKLAVANAKARLHNIMVTCRGVSENGAIHLYAEHKNNLGDDIEVLLCEHEYLMLNSCPPKSPRRNS
jgi:hypothetical protein